MTTRPISPGLGPVVRSATLRIALAASVYVVALSLQQAANHERERTAAHMARVHERIETAAATHEARATYAARYAQLRTRGRIGEPPRLAVVEAVRSVSKQLALRHVTFELHPLVSEAHVQSSGMTLRVGLVHEGELLRLVDGLRARAPGGLWVRRCTLERNAAGGPLQRESDNLVADCLLEWLTVRPR